MDDMDVLPELKEIAGAVLFAAKQPVTAAQIRNLLRQTAEAAGGATKDFAAASESDVAAAVEDLRADLERAKSGLRVVDIAGGYRIENRPACGPWLRTFLEKGRPNRLSQPAMETLAIIAYRQPVMRSEIEKVRGVAVDQILRNLLDLQLVRIVGRSELPGRPWLFGTTQRFLEHFGLDRLENLPGMSELQRMTDDASREQSAGEAARAFAGSSRQMELPAADGPADPAADAGVAARNADADGDNADADGDGEVRAAGAEACADGETDGDGDEDEDGEEVEDDEELDDDEDLDDEEELDDDEDEDADDEEEDQDDDEEELGDEDEEDGEPGDGDGKEAGGGAGGRMR